MKRVFIAIKVNLGEATVLNLQRIKAKLANEKIKWVDFNNVHITLKFLGDTAEEQIANINDELKTLCINISSFEINLQTMGLFRNIANPRALWIGIKDDGSIMQLHSEIEKKLQILGYKTTKQQFSPHMTLGRIKFLKNRKQLEDIMVKNSSHIFHTEQVTEIIIFESILSAEGAIHKELHKIELKN